MGTIIYNENVGAVGAKLLYPYISDEKTQKYSFTVQHAGDIIRESKHHICLYAAHNQNKYLKNPFESSISHNKECLLVTGAVLLTKKDIYQKLGGLDEEYWYGYEDIDYNLKLYQNNFKVMFASAALLFHHESATPKKSKSVHNHNTLCGKWSEFLFPKLLKDKIEKNLFFTDKKFEISIICDYSSFNNDAKIHDSIHELIKYLNKKDYNVKSILDMKKLDIASETDVLISYSDSYEIDKINARKNMIKILVISKKENEDNYPYYDIIITTDNNMKEELMKKYENIHFYNINDLNEITDKLIPILQKTYIEE